MGKKWKWWQTLLSSLQKSLQIVTVIKKLRHFAPWQKNYNKPRQPIKRQRHHFANKGLYTQSCDFSRRHRWMWELDHKEGWAPKSWCFLTVLEGPWDSREILLVNPKGDHCFHIHGKDWGWSWTSNDPATWCEELTHWKRPWCWEILRAGEGDDGGWGGWMASPPQWTWTWAHFRRWQPEACLARCRTWCHKELETVQWPNKLRLPSIPQPRFKTVPPPCVALCV